MRHDHNDDSKPIPDVSIIIINWNTAELLDQSLISIIKNICDISYEVIIVDNHSNGSDFKKVREKYSSYVNFIWIENNKNIGVLAVNQAQSICCGRYLLLLGPDTIVLPQSIPKMVHFLDNSKDAGAVTAKLLNPDGSLQNYYFKFYNIYMIFFSSILGQIIDKVVFSNRFRNYYFSYNLNLNDKMTIVEQPAAACLMIRRNSIATGKIMNNDFPFYFCDVDLCKRIYENGYKIFVLHSAEIIHLKSSSFKEAESNWKRKEYTLSAIKYFKKYDKNKVIIVKMILALDDIAYNVIKKIKNMKKI